MFVGVFYDNCRKNCRMLRERIKTKAPKVACDVALGVE